MGGSKENARKQLNNKPSQPPTTPSSAATGSAKKKRRKGFKLRLGFDEYLYAK
jgi:hypothetical protein